MKRDESKCDPSSPFTPQPSGARREGEQEDRADFFGDYFADQRYQDVLEEHSRRGEK